ncbi:hypothetical protein DY000_02030363 [Brassica cretica]|uniref:Terpene synthase N-terminal domain-containing protein n=1 Tax=Brassica cretica TaxID=69181 RepID=A0ABQ7DU88_BRACR|nr:hypothetical protein DY000_02030363 [Brassica cretica]
MDALRREMDTLKPNVRKTLMSSQAINSMKKRILMIYLLVRLGLVYHFENEIEESLKEGFQKIEEMMAGTDDLYTTSIIFWVFKTYGHHISTCKHSLPRHVMVDVGNNEMYKKRLSGDAKGLLALYEAAHLGTTTDYIMDEALSFASTHLEFFINKGTKANLVQLVVVMSFPLGVQCSKQLWYPSLSLSPSLCFFEVRILRDDRMTRIKNRGNNNLSGPRGPVAVDGPWMQTHSGFDPPAAETKSHCSAHHGCGYVRMKTREMARRGLHLPPGGLGLCL